jgi:ATP/ADP translocase
VLASLACSLRSRARFARRYGISERGGFNPAKEWRREKVHRGKREKAGKAVPISDTAAALFRRVPALRFLFVETLLCQGLSTVLNVRFISFLRLAFPRDQDRAVYMGKFYAAANAASGLTQFLVLPNLMPRADKRLVWAFMPLAMGCVMIASLAAAGPSLDLIAGAFLLMKVLEYSVRGVCQELLYVPLDFEARFVGKEVIGMLGYRLGKSGTSLVLSAAGYLGGGLPLQALTSAASAMTAAWCLAIFRLLQFVPAAAAVEKKKGGRGGKVGKGVGWGGKRMAK